MVSMEIASWHRDLIRLSETTNDQNFTLTEYSRTDNQAQRTHPDPAESPRVVQTGRCWINLLFIYYSKYSRLYTQLDFHHQNALQFLTFLFLTPLQHVDSASLPQHVDSITPIPTCLLNYSLHIDAP